MAGPAGERIGQGYVGVGIDDSALDRGLRESEAKVRDAFGRIDRVRARPEIEAEIREVMSEIAEVRTALTRLDAMKADPEVKIDDKVFNAQYAGLKAKLTDLNNRKVEIAVESRQLVDAEKDLKRATKSLNDFDAAANRAAEATRKQGLEVAKLRERYVSLSKQAKALSASKTFPSNEDRVRLERMNVELGGLASRIRTLGGSVNDLDVDVDRHNHTLSSWARSIANIRVHLGVMSLTIVQFIRAVTLLGPIIEGVAGSAIALTGSLGSALVGGAALGGAALTAFGIAATGVFQAVQPGVEELGNLNTAFEAAREAAIKYGKGSDEAKTAQENLNNMIKNSDPTIVRFARSTNQLGNEWQRLTDPTRENFWSIAQSGIDGLERMLPTLASGINRTMESARVGAEHWIDALSGQSAQQAVGNLMDNFASSLPSFMRGLENLSVALLNTFSEVSNHFDSLGNGFENWTQGILNATKAADFSGTVDGWINSLQQWGHLLQSTGDLITTFFGAGVKQGDNLVETITNVFDRWTEGMQTAEGQRSLADFFERSADMAERFFSTLGPVLEILFNLAQITAPITAGILEVVQAVADLVNAFTELDGVKDILQAIGVGIAAAFVVGRITAFAGALRGLLATLGLVKAATAGAAGLNVIGAAAGAATPAVGGLSGGLASVAAKFNLFAAGAGLAAGGMYLIAKRDEAWRKQLAKTKETIGQSNMALEGYSAHHDNLTEAFTAQAESIRERDRAMSKLPPALRDVRQSTEEAEQAEKNYQQTLDEFGPRSQKTYEAENDLRRARENSADASEKATDRIVDNYNAQDDAVSKAKSSMEEANKVLEDALDRADNPIVPLGGKGGAGAVQAAGIQSLSDGVHNYAEELDALRDTEKELSEAQNLRQASLVNISRVMAGMPEVTGKAAEQMGAFARNFGRVPQARKLLISTNSSQAVGELSKVANSAKRVAGQKAVIRVLTDSKTAEEAISRLNRLELKAKRQEIKESGAAQVIGKLNEILGINLPAKKQVAIATGFDTVMGRLGDIVGFNLPPKIQRILESGASTVFGVLGRLASASLPPIVQTITQVVRKAGFSGGAFAGGANASMVERAAQKAENKTPRDAGRGGRYSSPRFLVGEENRDEYVIATNPAYRQSNVGFLSQAAGALGFALVPGYAQGKGGKGGSGGPMFGPRSTYEELKFDIANNESLFSQMERHYQEQLSLGVKYPMPSLDDLIGQKGKSIDFVDDLIGLINDNLLKRLGRQAKQKLPKLGHKPPAKDENARKRWEKRKQQIERIKDQKKEARDTIPSMRREVLDLKNERYGYELDLASLVRGDVTPGGGGGTGSSGASIEEQFASFNQQRFDLLRSFGSNFMDLGSALGSGGGGFSLGASVPAGFQPNAVAAPTAPASAPGSGGGTTDNSKTVNQTVIMNQPTDPHLFTQALEWEAGAGG